MLCLSWFLVFYFQFSINRSTLLALSIALSYSFVLCNSTVASMTHRLASLPLSRCFCKICCFARPATILWKLHHSPSKEQVSMLLQNLCLEYRVCFRAFILRSRFFAWLRPSSWHILLSRHLIILVSQKLKILICLTWFKIILIWVLPRWFTIFRFLSLAVGVFVIIFQRVHVILHVLIALAVVKVVVVGLLLRRPVSVNALSGVILLVSVDVFGGRPHLLVIRRWLLSHRIE